MVAAALPAKDEAPDLFDDESGGDADADDPAIWIHPRDKRGSLVIATANNGGRRVYDLEGGQRQAIETPPAPGPDDEEGRFNNVDLAPGVALGGSKVDLAVVTDRGRDTLRFYAIDPKPHSLTDVTAGDVPCAFSAVQQEVDSQRTACGLGIYQAPGGHPYAVVSRRSTPEIGIFSFPLPVGSTWSPCTDPGDGPQVEGAVIDRATGVAHLAQEKVALWRIPIVGGRFRGEPRIVEKGREQGIPAAFDEAIEDCLVDYDAGPAGSPGMSRD